MQILYPFLFSVFLCVLLPFTSTAVQGKQVEFTGSCVSPIPPTEFVGTGCGIPAYVDPKEFGDNAYSSGTLKVSQRGRKMRFSINLRNLSRSDLVMTAWILWTIPPDSPDIFSVSSIPCQICETSSMLTCDTWTRLPKSQVPWHHLTQASQLEEEKNQTNSSIMENVPP